MHQLVPTQRGLGVSCEQPEVDFYLRTAGAFGQSQATLQLAQGRLLRAEGRLQDNALAAYLSLHSFNCSLFLHLRYVLAVLVSH